MPKVKIDLDAAAEAESFGALAINRREKNRGARLTKYGLTTAQLRVLRDSAANMVYLLKRAQQPVHVGKATFRLSERGDKEIVSIQGI